MSVFRKGLMNGKSAIVTGGGTGIGRAITEELVTLGCKVVIASRKEERLFKAAKEMDPTGSWVIPKVCNIRQEEDVKELVKFTLTKLHKVDYLINNGGGQFACAVEDMSFKGWKAVVDTNLNGTFLMCKEVYHQWMKDNGGSIVNIVADYYRGFPIMAHTGAARAGVDNLTKTLAVEWVENGIRVNAVLPGSNIYSPTAAANYGSDDVFDYPKKETPMKRLGHPKEISSGVVYLLSPGASFITGSTLRIDGAYGRYARQPWPISDHINHKEYNWEYVPPSEDDSGKSKL